MWYNGSHSITFWALQMTNGTVTELSPKNTWTHWNLIPASKPVVTPKSVTEKYVDIPGRNGPLDATTLLTGNVLYGNRKGTWSFYCITEGELRTFEEIVSDITGYLHGHEAYVVLDDEPNYRYHGRMKVSGIEASKDYPRVTLEYTFDPDATYIGPVSN